MTDNTPQAFIVYNGNGVSLEYTGLDDQLYPLIRDAHTQVNNRTIRASHCDRHRGWVQFQYEDAEVAAALHAVVYLAATRKCPDGHSLPPHIKTVDAPQSTTEAELNDYIDKFWDSP